MPSAPSTTITDEQQCCIEVDLSLESQAQHSSNTTTCCNADSLQDAVCMTNKLEECATAAPATTESTSSNTITTKLECTGYDDDDSDELPCSSSSQQHNQATGNSTQTTQRVSHTAGSRSLDHSFCSQNLANYRSAALSASPTCDSSVVVSEGDEDRDGQDESDGEEGGVDYSLAGSLIQLSYSSKPTPVLPSTAPTVTFAETEASPFPLLSEVSLNRKRTCSKSNHQIMRYVEEEKHCFVAQQHVTDGEVVVEAVVPVEQEEEKKQHQSHSPSVSVSLTLPRTLDASPFWSSFIYGADSENTIPSTTTEEISIPQAPLLTTASNFSPFTFTPLRSYPLPTAQGDYDLKKPILSLLPATTVVAAAPKLLDWRLRFEADILASERLGSDYASLEEKKSHDDEEDWSENDSEEEEKKQDQLLSILSSSTPVRAPPSSGGLLDPARVTTLLSQMKLKKKLYDLRQEVDNPAPTSKSHPTYSTRRDGTIQSFTPPPLLDYIPPPPPPPTMFTCGICFEEVEECLGLVFGQNRTAVGIASESLYPIPKSQKSVKCYHTFCRECITAYLEHEITNGKVLEVRCPGRNAPEQGSLSKIGPQCTCLAPSRWIETYVPKDIFEKYTRFKQLKQHDNYRSCPNRECLHVQQFVPLDADADGKNMKNVMICSECHTEYCFLHDLAHVGSSCKEYKKKLAAESAESLEHIKENTIKCPWPTCNTTTIKSQGCNHMTCSQCSTEYCYLCGGLYFGGLHFAPFNPFGCPGMKSDDLPANSRNTWWRMILRWVFGLPLFLAGVFAALGLFIALEAIYLVWVFALSPIWLIWALYIWNTHPSGLGEWETRRRKKRVKYVVGWGVYLIGIAICH